MTRFTRLSLAIVLALMLLPAVASAQMVPNTADPYELAPLNVHLYPISLNARIPYIYLPPIFAPAPMWRGAIDADVLRGQVAPHNWVAYEIPESTALVAWGAVKNDQRYVLEAANQQEFILLPPESQRDKDPSFMTIRTTMRFVPRCSGDELEAMLERELILPPSRVDSIADQLDAETLLTNYDRVKDVADIQPRVHPALQDELATQYWPVDRIYINYAGWRRNPNRIRTLGDFVSNWFTFEGKLLALKRWQGGDYLITVELEGYQPWYPIETAKNVMRQLISMSFDEFGEVAPYYDVELPLNGKEWYRQGSGPMLPYHTRTRWGTGSDGQGGY